IRLSHVSNARAIVKFIHWFGDSMRASIAITSVLAIAAAGVWITAAQPQTRPAAAQPAPRAADLVVRGGKIVTLDDARPSADAVGIAGDTIAAVGSTQDIQRFVGPSTRVIDLKGALAVPGFIDAHAHFTGVGDAARNLKLATAKNWDDIVRMVAEAAKTAKP